MSRVPSYLDNCTRSFPRTQAQAFGYLSASEANPVQVFHERWDTKLLRMLPRLLLLCLLAGCGAMLAGCEDLSVRADVAQDLTDAQAQARAEWLNSLRAGVTP